MIATAAGPIFAGFWYGCRMRLNFRSLFSAPEPPRKAKPVRPDPELAIKRSRVRALNMLEKKAPDTFIQVVLREAGYFQGEEAPPAPPPNSIRDFIDTAAALKKAGLPIAMAEEGRGSGDNRISEIIAALATGVGQYLVGPQLAARLPLPPTGLTEGRAVENGVPVVAVAPPAATLQITAPVEDEVDQSAIVIGFLRGQTPTAAATFMLVRPEIELKALVGALCSTEDVDLPALLIEWQGKYPQYRPVVQWLLATEQTEWLLQTVWELRRISGVVPRPQDIGRAGEPTPAEDWAGI